MSKKYICSQCGNVSSSQTAIKGSLGLEIVLWILFIIPGVIYSVWRSSSRYKVCPSCKSTSLVPIDSPVAKKMLSDQGRTVDEAIKDDVRGTTSVVHKITKGLLYFLGLFLLIGILIAIF